MKKTMNNNVLAGIAAIAVIGVGLALIAKPNAPITVNTPVNVSAPLETPSFGAVSGPNIDSDCLSVNGNTTCYGRMAFRTATTSVCALKSPSATSTIVSAIASVATAASYATSYELGEATSAHATTTSLGLLTVAASGNGTIVASTTPTGGSGAIGGILAPNTYINFRLSTSSTSSTFAPTGSCNVVFRVI